MAKQYHSKSKIIIGNLLLEWWKKNKRHFPWRYRKQPYPVLVAEMLLRKTTAKQVEKMYNSFLKKYPTPKALSEADENELKRILKPLGMEHHRTRLFIKFGRTVIEDYNEKIPSSDKELLKLPGVGLYATNAVLSFSHNKNVPIVDTNFIRVIKRVFDLKSSKARARNDKSIWDFASELIPEGKSREFNLAVLDFAATVCKPQNPACSTCSLVSICAFQKKNQTNDK